jgi:hypothetical protein
MITMEMSLEAVRKNLEYLEHYGVKGQKWGVRRTPEQLGHILEKKNARHYGRYNKAVKKISKIQGEKTIDQLTAKERAKIQKAIGSAEKQLSKMTSTEEKYGKKIQKAETRQAKIEEKAASKEAAENAKIEAKKTKLLEKQDWQAIMDNKKLFTERELSDVANRINTEKRLKEALEGPNKMDKLAEKVKSAANLAGAGVDLYNKVQGISNIVNEGKKEKAYKEIRQLMADGKNAEIIKKSINIGDKDIEVFDKRRKFLNELNKNLSKEPQTDNKGKSESKSEETDSKKEAEQIKKITNSINTDTTKIGKGKKAQNVDIITFDYDSNIKDQMQKIGSEKYKNTKSDFTSGIRIEPKASSNDKESFSNMRSSMKNINEVAKLQSRLGSGSYVSPLSNKGVVSEKYRIDRIDSSNLNVQQKHRAHEITEAVNTLSVIASTEAVRTQLKAFENSTPKNVESKLTKKQARIQGKLNSQKENIDSLPISSRSIEDITSKYRTTDFLNDVYNDAKLDRTYTDAYNTLSSVSKKEANDLKYFIPSSARVFAGDIPSGLDDNYDMKTRTDYTRRGQVPPWENYTLSHSKIASKFIEHSAKNMDGSLQKLYPIYIFLVLNDVGDFKLSDFKK